MKSKDVILTAMLVLMTTSILGQTNMKEYKAGHVFYVSLPDYMSKTSGINDDAVIQFKNVLKDIGGYIIEDTKEELSLLEISFSSINDFYDYFLENFLIKEKKRNVSQPVAQTIGDVKFIELDASYYSEDSDVYIYYFVGIAETNDAFYKVLCYASLENKDKYKVDFQNILYSIKD